MFDRYRFDVVELVSLPPNSARSTKQTGPQSVLKSYANGELTKIRDSGVVLLVSYADSSNSLTILQCPTDVKKARDGLCMSVFDFGTGKFTLKNGKIPPEVMKHIDLPPEFL
jgi:hypothetical protein